ncbi:hypothetical protein N7539_008783 [Penicillium diatomitis]|uniref:DRBM domain-containing protein n=1 Tax=Penicillium diatomitis TaxID=2819901 RepID=A0A9W9WQJ2_9EURO|nr:uncharacterized protein N7539_008783 [Penicillium diatomitis]KAJ5471840.1 hypothetical protein N7539_008783 [Penicillium diatomitis]
MVNSDSNIASLDELLGKVTFQAFVTGLSARVQEGNLEIMASIEFLEKYDYAAGLSSLRESHTHLVYNDSDEQPQHTLFQILGFTYRTDSELAAYRLIQHILNPHNKEATSTVKPFGFVETPIAASDNDLPKYTSSLFMEAQRWGEIPHQEDMMSSFDPPQFEVKISFRGVTCTGVAQRKKVARHLAAREICQRLNIGI